MFVFNVCVSSKAVTTVDTSNVYQIMLTLILACVCICVFACAHVLRKPVRACVCEREFTFPFSEYFVYLYALLRMYVFCYFVLCQQSIIRST